MRKDDDETIRAPAFDKLDLYCDRVASAVGRLSVRVFGMDETPGRDLAHHLGRALQLTNILRDLDEDAAMGRLYLPTEALCEGGIDARDPAEVLAHPGVDAACRWLATIAHDHYQAADDILSAKPAGRLRAPRLMSAIYGEILARMETSGWNAPRARAKIGKGALVWIVLRRGLLG
jgi:phytoene synthase